MVAYNLTADGYGVTSALNARTAADEMCIRDRLFVYFFLTIKAPEDSSLITFGNALAGIGYFDLHIHFPRYHRCLLYTS